MIILTILEIIIGIIALILLQLIPHIFLIDLIFFSFIVLGMMSIGVWTIIEPLITQSSLDLNNKI